MNANVVSYLRQCAGKYVMQSREAQPALPTHHTTKQHSTTCCGGFHDGWRLNEIATFVCITSICFRVAREPPPREPATIHDTSLTSCPAIHSSLSVLRVGHPSPIGLPSPYHAYGTYPSTVYLLELPVCPVESLKYRTLANMQNAT